MRIARSARTARRPGQILVLFVILLVALLGMLGLVIDCGLLMATHRKTQNAADSAATAAAMDLMRGQSAAVARAKAQQFALTYYGVTLADADVRIPPTTGPYAGNASFVEVVASHTYESHFIQVTGAASTHAVSARAVAGYEPVSSGEGAIVLDPRATRAGLVFNGVNTRLQVKGTVVVNNGGSGVDQYGQPISTSLGTTNQPAVVTSNTAISDPTQAYVRADAVLVRGGVDQPLNFRDIIDPANSPSPLYAGMGMSPDPLRTLPVPVVTNTYPSPTSTTATGTIPAKYPSLSVSTGQTVTFNPGVYTDINITGGTVVFRSGIYVFAPDSNNQGLRISGGTTTSEAGGVMFYFGASTYQDGGSPGSLDIADGAFDGPLPPTNGSYTLPADANSVRQATLAIAGSSGSVTLEGYAYNTSDPNDRILFFARRRNQDPNGNTSLYSIGGSGSGNMALDLKGTIYSKWASFSLSGGGTYNAQFIVGSLTLGGGATITINGTGINRGRANQVFLVE